MRVDEHLRVMEEDKKSSLVFILLAVVEISINITERSQKLTKLEFDGRTTLILCPGTHSAFAS